MDDKSFYKNSYVQCLHCGKIFKVNKEFFMDDPIVSVSCPNCGRNKGLYCGTNRNELYEMYDSFLDERFFNYE